MSGTTFYRRRAERFAQLLDEANGGRRHHSRSRVDSELAEFVALGHRTAALRPTVEPEIDPDFRAGLRAMLVATAEREGIGVTAVATDPLSASRVASAVALPGFGRRAGQRASGESSGIGSRSPRGRRLRARGAVLVGVAVGAIAVSGISTASEDAVPGDALYGVKRSTERAQLALASSDANRGQLYLDFARTRLTEATALDTSGAGLPTVLTDMDSDTRQGVKLLTTAATSRRDEGALRAIDAFVAGQHAGVSQLVSGTTGTDRLRAAESRTLLEDVNVRVDALRRTLACGASPDAGTDSLGPLPRTCGALPQTSNGGNQRDRRGETPATTREVEPAAGTPEKAPTTAPDRHPPVPSTAPTSTAPPVPAETPGQATDEGLFDQLGRALGDLLGG